MKDFRSEFSVARMAGVFDVSQSGFYAWLNRPQSRHKQQKQRFDVEVRSVFEASDHRYGSEKVAKTLEDRGYSHNRKRVAASMKRQGLRSKVCRKFRVQTTDTNHAFPFSPNLLNRQFSVAVPDQVYVTDITYLPSKVGWLYLTVFIDLFSRLVVGWCVSTSLGHEPVVEALYRAIWRRKPPKGLMIHSDGGVQFCCRGFRSVLETSGFIQSMSRRGNCWDNAVAESFFKTLKTELIYHIDLLDENHARHVLFDYIEVFYNRQRLHATLGYVSPAQYETAKLAKSA
jgi:transposase InsO family protein